MELATWISAICGVIGTIISIIALRISKRAEFKVNKISQKNANIGGPNVNVNSLSNCHTGVKVEKQ